MRVLPTIAGTVANWGLQNSLADSSGNGLNLALDSGNVVYETLSGCLSGFKFQDPIPGTFNGLIAPSSSLLRLAGEFTFQFLINEHATFVQTYLQCDPLLYSFFFHTGTSWAYADQHVNARLGPPFIFPAPDVVRSYGLRRRLTSPGNYLVDGFVDGVLQAGTLATTTNTPTGTERLRIGAFSGGANLRATMASMRILSVARSDADILADHNLMFGPCADPMKYRGLVVRIGDAQ